MNVPRLMREMRGPGACIILSCMHNFVKIKMRVLKFRQLGELVFLFSHLPNPGQFFTFTFKVSVFCGNCRFCEI